MKRSMILLFAATAMMAACGGGNNNAVETSDPEAPAEATLENATYTVDVNESILHWEGKKATYSHAGTVKLSSGDIKVEGNEIAAGNFTVDMRTIEDRSVEDEAERQKLVGHLKSADFFHVDSFPTAAFEITGVTANSQNGATHTVSGNLTIKGVTKKVSFPATVSIQDNMLSASAKFIVNRADFNVRYGSGTFFDNLGDKIISDDINFKVELKARS